MLKFIRAHEIIYLIQFNVYKSVALKESGLEDIFYH